MLEAGQFAAGGEQVRQQRRLGDGKTRAGITHDVRDLLGRQRLVDREWRRADRGGRQVDQVELWSVTDHQRHRIAAADAELGEAAGDGVDALR